MRTRSSVLLASLVGLVLGACGSSGGSGSAATTAPTPSTTASPTTVADTMAPDTSMAMDMTTHYPLTITNCGRKETFTKAPSKVLILNGTSVAEVESLLVLGLKDSILANSQSYGQTDVPGLIEQIKALPDGGLKLNENFEVPKEQVLALQPDLVLSTWAGGFTEKIGSATRDELDAAGINSLVTPINCAYGADNPSAEDQKLYDSQTYEASYDYLRQLGEIFDVQDRAEKYIKDAKAQIAAVAKPTGSTPVNVLVAYPGMSMMNPAGVPQVFAGPLSDSIISAAGGVDSFAGLKSFNDSVNINAEALAKANVDVLVVGLFQPGEDAATYAKAIFAQYPQWNAAKNNRFISIAESFYLGPYNAVAIKKIADAVAAVG